MEVALVIGHTRFRKGAYSPRLMQYEYDFYKRYEHILKTLGDVFYHNPYTTSYTKRQKAMAKKTKNYDLVFELHFNSSDGTAAGCEALYYFKNNKTRVLSEKFCREYSVLSNARNRGAKELHKPSQRGYGFVYYQKPNAIILEPFFGDNLIDVQKFDITNFIEALRRTIPCED